MVIVIFYKKQTKRVDTVNEMPPPLLGLKKILIFDAQGRCTLK